MLLYANGDSHTAGTYTNGECFYETSFSSLLAKRHNLDYFNHAWPGGSNKRIIRTSKEYLKDKDPTDTLVLVCWSSFERTEWYVDGIWHQICKQPMYEYVLTSIQSEHPDYHHDLLKSSDLTEPNKRYMPNGADWSRDSENWKILSERWNDYTSTVETAGNGAILMSRQLEFQYYANEFSEWLTDKGFKHMFMHSIDYWWVPNDDFKQPYNKHVWLYGDSFNPKLSFVNKVVELGHTPDDHSHYSPEAHKDYADFIEQEFINKLLK